MTAMALQPSQRSNMLQPDPSNMWQGPPSLSSSSAAMSRSLSKKSGVAPRTIRRKPPPRITEDLFAEAEASSNIAPTQSTSSTTTVTSREPPIRPTHSNISPQILHTTRAPFPAPATKPTLRVKKSPLRWMQEKEEHASTSRLTSSPSTSTLGRKSSFSTHLKLGLRRKPSTVNAEQRVLEVSSPTNFVHVATAAEPAQACTQPVVHVQAGGDRPSNSSAREDRSSLSSMHRAVISPQPDSVSHEPLARIPTLEKVQPLRPAKSVRRPNKNTSPEIEAPAVFAKASSPRDKRKAIYAGRMPELANIGLEHETNAASSTGSSSSIASTFASTLNNTLAHAQGAVRAGHSRAISADSTRIPYSRLDPGVGSPRREAPELSRSPSSTYTSSSSSSSSNRSSFTDFTEIQSFLDFPDKSSYSPIIETRDDSNDSDLWSSIARARRDAFRSTTTTHLNVVRA
ncbi:hypothetical protein BCV70DRAFT_33566 [Testicularia cyperi]|uniref:Uncharacterized protein n=1 Tax=Testicularia cyperi TaxID=1882483 RepID=A0A317XL48_9BASI|nr:hypothetical protein BCV70DRAFT_33566 [Testicularia cyperi]